MRNVPTCKQVTVEDPSQVGEARREANSLALEGGFSETEIGRICIVTTEAANNLVLHGGGGEILLQLFDLAGDTCLDLLALDRGGGMVNVKTCLEDGYSTGGTAGTGMGAMSRLADEFDIYSQPGKGTVVFARWSRKLNHRTTKPAFEVGVACAPHPRETVSGDRWSVHFSPLGNPAGLQAMVADGLGHGPKAAEAAVAAIESFHLENQDRTPEHLLQNMHGRLRATRGAAISIVEIRLDTRKSHFVGLGNVAGALLYADQRKQMATLHGTVGIQLPRTIRGFDYPWPDRGLLILHSDGLVSRCGELGAYPGLQNQHPSVIAAVLLRDFRRGNDDATVLVARERV